MHFDPERHHRRSIRVRDYDYSQVGAYFVTICVEQRRCLFGDVIDEMLQLNDAGNAVLHWWHEFVKKYEHVETEGVVVMPNHLHGIIFIEAGDPSALGDHTGSPLPALGDMIGWFKTMSTNEYIHGVKERGWDRFAGRLWQRNYFEHIIRNDAALDRARTYIDANPSRWQEDEENPAFPARNRTRKF